MAIKGTANTCGHLRNAHPVSSQKVANPCSNAHTAVIANENGGVLVLQGLGASWREIEAEARATALSTRARRKRGRGS